MLIVCFCLLTISFFTFSFFAILVVTVVGKKNSRRVSSILLFFPPLSILFKITHHDSRQSKRHIQKEREREIDLLVFLLLDRFVKFSIFVRRVSWTHDLVLWRKKRESEINDKKERTEQHPAEWWWKYQYDFHIGHHCHEHSDNQWNYYCSAATDQ